MRKALILAIGLGFIMQGVSFAQTPLGKPLPEISQAGSSFNSGPEMLQEVLTPDSLYLVQLGVGSHSVDHLECVWPMGTQVSTGKGGVAVSLFYDEVPHPITGAVTTQERLQVDAVIFDGKGKPRVSFNEWVRIESKEGKTQVISVYTAAQYLQKKGKEAEPVAQIFIMSKKGQDIVEFVVTGLTSGPNPEALVVQAKLNREVGKMGVSEFYDIVSVEPGSHNVIEGDAIQVMYQENGLPMDARLHRTGEDHYVPLLYAPGITFDGTTPYENFKLPSKIME
ncbi:MAG: hypothetical protein JW734_04545 [Candidatus Omnitrophica bacterium]|nr:hypothetical protein [Candidatus Omnitrophota bacterium]